MDMRRSQACCAQSVVHHIKHNMKPTNIQHLDFYMGPSLYLSVASVGEWLARETLNRSC